MAGKEGKPIRVVIESASQEVQDNLPAAIHAFLDSPETELNPKEVEKHYTPFYAASLLPPFTPQLSESFQILTNELDPGGEMFYGNFRRALAAYLLATSILHQTSLPPEKRVSVKSALREKSVLADNLRNLHSHISQSLSQKTRDSMSIVRDETENAVSVFKSRVERLREKPIENEEEAMHQVNLVNDVFIMTKSSSHVQFTTYAGADDRQWLSLLFTGKTIALAQTNLVQDLLSSGRLEEIDEFLRATIWKTSFFNEARDDDTWFQEYFFMHSELHKYIWSDVMKSTSDGSGNPLRLEAREGIIEWFLTRDAQTIDQFLDTVPQINEEQARTTLFRRLLGIVGRLKVDFPKMEGIQEVIARVDNIISKVEGDPRYSHEISVLRDEEVGVIYLNLNHEARALTASAGESREDYSQRVKSLGTEPIYVSKAPWPEAAKPVEKHIEQKKFVLGEAELRVVRPWGEVQIPAATDLLSFLQKTVPLKTSEVSLYRLIDEYSGMLSSSAEGDIILPSLLPSNHPLYSLTSLGIVAVSHINGEVQLLIDAEKVGIQTLGPRKLLLKGGLNAGIFEVPEAEEKFLFSPLHLLLSSAALFGKTNFPPSKLEKEDQRGAHELQKVWGLIAKTLDLPPISHLESMQASSEYRVRTFINKKGTYFSLVGTAA